MIARTFRCCVAWCLLVVFAFLSTACGTLSAQKIDAQVKASADINPDLQGRPSPVVVKIFQLKTKDAFALADYQTLIQKPESLGDDVVQVDELVIPPNGQRRMVFDLAPGAKYLAAMATYRDVDHAQWRSSQSDDIPSLKVFKLPGVKNKPAVLLQVSVEKNFVRIGNSEPEEFPLPQPGTLALKP